MSENHYLDASGLFCPEPVMLLHNKVRDACVGDRITLLATDPSTERDVPKFCRFLGHRLEVQEKRHESFYYEIVVGVESR